MCDSRAVARRSEAVRSVCRERRSAAVGDVVIADVGAPACAVADDVVF